MSVTINGVVLSNQTVTYLETVLWAETVILPCDENDLVDGCMDVDEDHELHGISEGEPLDNHFGLDDFDAESLRKAEADCDEFFDHIFRNGLEDAVARAGDDESAAYDFWLTRNGHGAGFWDGDWDGYEENLGDNLTAICKNMGECYVYIGDDCKLHLS